MAKKPLNKSGVLETAAETIGRTLGRVASQIDRLREGETARPRRKSAGTKAKPVKNRKARAPVSSPRFPRS